MRMGGLFLRLLNMSIQASVLIVIVVLLRLILKKSPKWIYCLLWVLVAIRLICPFSIESIFSLAPNAEVISTTVSDSRPNIRSGVTQIDRHANLYIENYYLENLSGQEITKVESINLIHIVSFVWLAGIVVLMIYAFVRYLIIWRRVKESICIKENIFICDRIGTPFILGIVRPYIYLPSNMNDEQMSSVIAHEQAHLKRGDHFWKPFAYCLLVIYWFNPLCWVAYILLCRDIELACDEKVIKDMDIEQKKIYSKTLLSFSEPGRLISACPLAFGEVGVKQRIKSVLNYKKPAFWITIISLVAIIITSVLFLTNPKEKIAEGEEQTVDAVFATTGEDDTFKKMVEVGAPTIDLSATTGADGSCLYYADKDKFIFGGYYGFFVYDMNQKEIVRGIDLAAIGCNYTQGDSACEISVTDDGNLVLLHPKNQTQMYVYSVNDNTMSLENYNMDGYNLYRNQYSGDSYGKFASYEVNGELRYVVLVNDYTIGELGYTPDEKMSSHQIIFANNDNIEEGMHYEEIPENLKYEFDGCTVEPRWYTFDGFTLRFCYDVIGEKNIVQDISVKLEDEDIETVYYLANKSDERTIMWAIIHFNEYHSSADISITNKGDSNATAYQFHIEQNE